MRDFYILEGSETSFVDRFLAESLANPENFNHQFEKKALPPLPEIALKNVPESLISAINQFPNHFDSVIQSIKLGKNADCPAQSILDAVQQLNQLQVSENQNDINALSSVLKKYNQYYKNLVQIDKDVHRNRFVHSPNSSPWLQSFSGDVLNIVDDRVENNYSQGALTGSLIENIMASPIRASIANEHPNLEINNTQQSYALCYKNSQQQLLDYMFITLAYLQIFPIGLFFRWTIVLLHHRINAINL